MPPVAVAPAHRRHDISDRVWEILEPLLPGGKGKTGRPAQDNRRFINAVFWILRTGAPWRDLPPDYGDWKNTHRRFCRWRDRNVWAGLLEAVMDDPDYEWDRGRILPTYLRLCRIRSASLWRSKEFCTVGFWSEGAILGFHCSLSGVHYYCISQGSVAGSLLLYKHHVNA